MKEFKGTPPPWHFSHNLNEDSKSDMGGFVGINGKTVCWFGDDEAYCSTAGTIPDKEDIYLIAAAPELLEALQVCLPWVNSGLSRQIHNKAQAAINKALGIKE